MSSAHVMRIGRGQVLAGNFVWGGHLLRVACVTRPRQKSPNRRPRRSAKLYMLKSGERAALNHFLKKPAGVAPMAPMAVSPRVTVLLFALGIYEELLVCELRVLLVGVVCVIQLFWWVRLFQRWSFRQVLCGPMSTTEVTLGWRRTIS